MDPQQAKGQGLSGGPHPARACGASPASPTAVGEGGDTPGLFHFWERPASPLADKPGEGYIHLQNLFHALFTLGVS